MAAPIPPQISLRALREALGKTLDEVAEAIRDQGVPISTTGLNNAELGHRQASEQLLIAWTRALGVKRIHVRQAPELREWLDSCNAATGAEREAAAA